MTNDNQTWWRCFSFPELKHICDITGDEENPPDYDPRMKGNGEIIWQKVTDKN